MDLFSKPIVSKSPEATVALGQELAGCLRGGMTVALHGDLGSGKTVISKGIARGLGIHEAVTSPTFTIMQEYMGDAWRLYHIDLYRLHGLEDALAFGLEDFVGAPDAVTVIEWAERVDGLVSRDLINIYFENPDENERIIRICRA